MMATKRMSAREAREKFADLLGMVHYANDAVIIEKQGKPFAVVISPSAYEVLQRLEEEAWATVQEIRERNADKDPDEVLRDITQEVEAVRQKMYDASRKLAQGGH